MIALFPIFARGRIRTSLRVVEVLSSASSRSLPDARRKCVFSLCMPLFLFILNHDSAGAEDPASSPPATPPPATRSAREVAPPESVEARLRRLEALISTQAEQIQRLSAENRVLAAEVRGRSVASSDPRVKPAQTEAALPPALPSPTVPGGTVDESTAPSPESAFTVPPESASAFRAIDSTPSAYSSLLESGNDAIPEVEPSELIPPYLTGRYDKGFVLVAPNDKKRT